MVYIDKLVCRGFKSFGRDTVTIKFHPGFTCIVGPNGSGKSNVVDALLFVLGQLSAKTLRANVFSDLLYSPPKPGMPPKAKSALVQVHFNNKDRKLPVDADKVVIERELDESGKSVCRVNGRVVTRSAVLDLLSSIGVDPNGYNLVLQGEIAQMVQVSPTDRRKLIEDIAGISAYDEQKERALKKLQESEANLSRVETQLQERRHHLEKLENEREDALRYESIKAQIREIRIDHLAWTIVRAQKRIATIDTTLAERAQEAEDLERQLRETERERAKIEQEIGEIEEEIDRVTGGESARISEKFGVLSSAVEHARHSLERMAEDIEAKRKEKEALESELEELRRRREASATRVKEKQEQLEQLEREIAEREAHLSNLQRALQEEQDLYYETQQKLQALNDKIVSLDERIAEVRSSIKTGERESRALEEDREQAETALEKTAEKLSELEHSIPEIREELTRLEEMEQAKRNELEGVDRQLKTLDAEIAETQKILTATREELIKIKARRDALKEAEEAFLKRRRAIARVLQLRDEGVVKGIFGTVAELGTIDPELSTALEIAGGSRLGYIVVENEDVATECIEILKRERAGRASFIPLNRIKSRKPSYVPDDERVIGYAMDLVKFNPQVQPAFEFVFSDTIVTEDFSTAKRLGFKGWRAVSLDGDLVERSGLITGGYHQRTPTGLSLKIEDRSPEIERRLQGLESILDELADKRNSLARTRRELEREIQDLTKTSYRMRIKAQLFQEQHTELVSRQESLKQRIEAMGEKLEKIRRQLAELHEEEKSLSLRRESLLAERERYSERIAQSRAMQVAREMRELQKIVEDLKHARESLHSEVTELTVALSQRYEPRIAEIENRIDAVCREVEALKAREASLRQELDSKERELEETGRARERIEDRVKDRRTQQLELKERARNLRFRHEQIRDAQTANEKAVYRLQTERSRLETEIEGWRAELDTLSDCEAEIQKRSSEREPTYKELDQLTDKIRELERELEEMGPVNLKSLTDYDAERERYEEIVDKKAQLEEEHKEILRFMEELEREKTRKFLQVYNEIADNFSRVFAKLSPGGEASLMLENPEHPLMGGVTVRSKPRGKEVVSLTAMSGGEKTLTGLALIFAIQMYSPASFYVFDEIDAALDDVNAHNVALLIQEMSKSSQFIVVSLRDVTAQKADVLVGVSNQDGISRIVAVDLEEVGATA